MIQADVSSKLPRHTKCAAIDGRLTTFCASGFDLWPCYAAVSVHWYKRVHVQGLREMCACMLRVQCAAACTLFQAEAAVN